MTRHTLAALALVTAIAAPAAAQSPTATTKSKTTITTSNGAIADTVAKITTTTTVIDSTTKSPVTTVAPTMAAPSIALPTIPAPAVTGQVTPTEAARVNVKVAESLAATAKVSGDSAFVLARASVPDGTISSAELEMKKGRLVYEIKLLNKDKGASEVTVDAMSGEVVKDKKFGGAKAVLEHHKENAKLLDAKRDSSGTKKP